jgi:hypothetical protein
VSAPPDLCTAYTERNNRGLVDVNALAPHHQPIAEHFTGQGAGRFTLGHWRSGRAGAPLLVGGEAGAGLLARGIQAAGDASGINPALAQEQSSEIF